MADTPDTPDLEFYERPINRKAVSALSLRVAGASLDEICQVVGFASKKEAVTAIDKALKDELASDPRARKKMQELANRRLETLMRSVWRKATNPADPEHLPAVGKAKELIDRHIKLFGLDAPTQMVVHNPDSGEIESWVMSILAKGGSELDDFDVLAPPSMDVIEGEVEDDDGTSGVRASA